MPLHRDDYLIRKFHEKHRKKEICGYCGKATNKIAGECQHISFFGRICKPRVNVKDPIRQKGRARLCEECAKKCEKCTEYFCPRHIKRHACKRAF